MQEQTLQQDTLVQKLLELEERVLQLEDKVQELMPLVDSIESTRFSTANRKPPVQPEMIGS